MCKATSSIQSYAVLLYDVFAHSGWGNKNVKGGGDSGFAKDHGGGREHTVHKTVYFETGILALGFILLIQQRVSPPRFIYTSPPTFPSPAFQLPPPHKNTHTAAIHGQPF